MADIPGNTSTNKTLQRNKGKGSNIGFVGDEDWFKVNLKANNEYSFQVKGSDTSGGTLVDPRVTIYAGNGTTVEASDDNSGAGRNALAEFRPATSGTYFVAVDESGDDATGSYKVSYQLLNTAPGETGDAGINTEKRIKVGQTQQGDIQPSGDDDWYRIQLQPGTYTAEARNVNTTLPFRADVYIFNDSGTIFDNSSQDATSGGIGRDNVFTITTAGTYFVDVGDTADTNTGSYRVTVANGDTTGVV